jgi:hypothetical protein
VIVGDRPAQLRARPGGSWPFRAWGRPQSGQGRAGQLGARAQAGLAADCAPAAPPRAAEFKKWCPTLRVVRLHTSDPMEKARLRKEVLADPSQFDVAVTTYDMINSKVGGGRGEGGREGRAAPGARSGGAQGELCASTERTCSSSGSSSA